MKKIHRFYYPEKYSLNETITIKDQDLSKQISKVLRLKIGEEIILFDGNLNEALCEIEDIGKELTVNIKETSKNEVEPERKVTLYASVIKKDNFEWMVQKAVEVGVYKIIPIITRRTIKLNLNIERLRKISKEAAEQSGRGIVPEISEIMKLEKAIEDSKENGLTAICDITGEDPKELNASKIGLFIGPEGGFESEELDLFETKIKLGSTTFRAETAGIIAAHDLI